MKDLKHEKKKIGVIGVGAVGATTAFVLTIKNIADEIVLLDHNEARARGEALDISHCVPFVSPIVVRAGKYEDLADADIVVITASVPMLNFTSRLDLLRKNISIIREISDGLMKVEFNGIILNVSNPVDILSYFLYKFTGLPAKKIIGTGTVLDSARFRYLIGRNCGIDPRSVHAYILGEHGDSEVPVWSQANIAGMNLQDACCACERKCKKQVFDHIFEEAKVSAYHIIKGKGSTNYAIAMCAMKICKAILSDENRVLPVSTLLDGYLGINDMYMSLPTVVNRQGVKKNIMLPLNEKEKAAFIKSAEILKEEASRHKVD
ncbi:MAG: L-lactate dehydrogenase [Candidatus Eremiobacteraeota bacterium]|nr:L-lactate dehydrogenase [Candidatus Eremiobacteraeota bacterium]